MLIDEFIPRCARMMEEALRTQREPMLKAADAITEAIDKGHTLFAFGASHAGILAQEIYYRAGGLMLVNPIFPDGLMLNSRPPTRTSLLERVEGFSRTVMQTTPLRAGDVLIVCSTSGRNPVPIEMAMEGKARGATVVGLTSLAYSTGVRSRHSSGKNLYEIADIVIDNCGIIGEAILEIPGMEQKTGSTSNIIGSAILHSIIAQVVENLAARGKKPPVYVSANLDGGDEQNARLLAQHAHQIHYM